jgi:carboxymethylenebutenolidase
MSDDRNGGKKRVVERRAFLARLAASAMAAALAAQLDEGRSEAAQIAADDARLHTERVTVPNGAKGLRCYFAQPLASPDKLGAVIVVHNNLGPTQHFEDVARRLALEGFMVLLPDYASRMGGTPSEEDPARTEISMLTWNEVVADTQAAIIWLKARGDSDGKVTPRPCSTGGFRPSPTWRPSRSFDCC